MKPLNNPKKTLNETLKNPKWTLKNPQMKPWRNLLERFEIVKGNPDNKPSMKLWKKPKWHPEILINKF